MLYPILRPRAVAALAAAALAVPAAASAHVTLQPDTAPAGGFTRLDVRVPNERDDAGTTQVRLQLPPGFEFVSYEPQPGWKAAVKQGDDGVGEITWTGGIIRPGQFMDFGLSVKMPDGEAGDELTFKALQTYQGGEIVRWIGPEDAEEPAPIVTLTSAEGEAGPASSDPAPASATVESDDGGDGLTVIALVVGALGLAAGLAGLLAARRSRT